ncbi:hypothetical protein A9P82_07665 [Arachidicoccus ginsenosidimutans]|uniref:Crp/Fnr family transcriptional regulator n=1 Tax=Arachidicoccus sp. BS20 TaxID=1850526 RepID=UPI0007F10A98|nr:helix-turn-helix domain-containing protein [Arachidicoccus sp. BS20]ANI89178.1 hypothetical protein A9P82_07665 [Arachidicoccus sp. BS20]
MENFSSSNSFLSDKLLQEIIAVGTVKELKKEDVFLERNRYVNILPIVLHGSLTGMITDSENKEISMTHIKEGETCVMLYLSGMYREKTKVKIIAEVDSEIVVLSIENALKLNNDSPEWATYLLNLYHQKFNRLLNTIQSIAFKKMDERVLEFLREKEKLYNRGYINLSHAQIAYELGSSRVVISRTLKQLAEAGELKLARHRIYFLKKNNTM